MLPGGPATTSVPLPLPGQQPQSAGCPCMSIPDRVTKVRVERPRWDCQACEGMGARQAALGPQPSDGVEGLHTCTRASSRVGKRVRVHVFVRKLVGRDLRRGSRTARRGSLSGGGRNQGAEWLPCSRPGGRRSDQQAGTRASRVVLGKENQTRRRGSVCPAHPSPLLPQPPALACGQAGSPTPDRAEGRQAAPGRRPRMLGPCRASCPVSCAGQARRARIRSNVPASGPACPRSNPFLAGRGSREPRALLKYSLDVWLDHVCLLKHHPCQFIRTSSFF